MVFNHLPCFSTIIVYYYFQRPTYLYSEIELVQFENSQIVGFFYMIKVPSTFPKVVSFINSFLLLSQIEISLVGFFFFF